MSRLKFASLGTTLLMLACGSGGGKKDEATAETTASTGTGTSSGGVGQGGSGGEPTTSSSSSGGQGQTSGETTSSPSSTTTSGTGGSAGAPNGDVVPVFVAVADGGWTATSCDLGRSWTAREFDSVRDDHSPWTAFGGLAYGNEAFVLGTGWGYPGHVIYSDDGLSWTDLTDGSFFEGGEDVGFEEEVGAVVFDGSEFIVFGYSLYRSSDGLRWERTPRTLPPGTDIVRQARAFPDTGLIVMNGEAQLEGERPLGHFIMTSEDGGETWSEGTGYESACLEPIQHYGDIVAIGDTILAGGRRLCRSDDRGQSWTATDVPVPTELGDLFTDGEAFYAVPDVYAQSGVIMRSEDGTSWDGLGDIGSEVSLGTRGAGTFVAISKSDDQPHFYYSDDGESWSEGEFTTDLAPVMVREVGFGMVACPTAP